MNIYYKSQFTESIKLSPLEKEALKYSEFEEFSKDYSLNQMYGRYWHFTDNPEFKLNKNYMPTDNASGSKGKVIDSGGGFMVTSIPSQWGKASGQLSDRPYAVEVDISELIKNKDFVIVNRGFGQELFIKNLDNLKVSSLMPYKKAMSQASSYIRKLPQSKNELYKIWSNAHELL